MAPLARPINARARKSIYTFLANRKDNNPINSIITPMAMGNFLPCLSEY